MLLTIVAQAMPLLALGVTVLLDYFEPPKRRKKLLSVVLLCLGAVAWAIGLLETLRRDREQRRGTRADVETVWREITQNRQVAREKSGITSRYVAYPDTADLEYDLERLERQSFTSLGLTLMGSRFESLNAFGDAGKTAAESMEESYKELQALLGNERTILDRIGRRENVQGNMTLLNDGYSWLEHVFASTDSALFRLLCTRSFGTPHPWCESGGSSPDSSG